MTNKADNKPKFKVLDFKPVEEERDPIPDGIMVSIEALYKKAKEGKIKEIVLYAEWEPEDGDEEDEGRTGSMSIWNKTSNIRAIVGTIEMLKSVAVEALMSSFYLSDEEDG